jgi:hypothetical protein
MMHELLRTVSKIERLITGQMDPTALYLYSPLPCNQHQGNRMHSGSGRTDSTLYLECMVAQVALTVFGT